MEPRKDYYAPMHTAEHILNQTMVRMFSCERSFSNHIERKKSKCDYRFERALEQSELVMIEQQVNEVIKQHLTVSDEVLSFDEAAKNYHLGKVPDEMAANIRIVHVGNYDSCPCIGLHVANTSEIGTFKITTCDYNDGILRLRYKLLD